MSIVIRCSTNSSIVSTSIRAVTWGKYSHVDFVLPDGRYLGALSSGVSIYNDVAPVEIFMEMNCTPEQEQMILKYATEQVGKPYDFMGIVGFIFRRNWQESDRWFCSELVAASVVQSGIRLFGDEQSNHISPRDLTINPLFSIIPKPANIQ